MESSVFSWSFVTRCSSSHHQVMHMFKGCRREDSAPHIYAVAQSAYRNLLTTRQDQSIVLLGKSGSGKTTNCQHLVQYLVSIAGSTGKIFSGESAKTKKEKQTVVPRWAMVCGCLYHNGGVAAEKWQAVYTILEAFGNSSTSMNTNASRFSHVVSLDFDQAGQVASASIQVTHTHGISDAATWNSVSLNISETNQTLSQVEILVFSIIVFFSSQHLLKIFLWIEDIRNFRVLLLHRLHTAQDLCLANKCFFFK